MCQCGRIPANMYTSARTAAGNCKWRHLHRPAHAMAIARAPAGPPQLHRDDLQPVGRYAACSDHMMPLKLARVRNERARRIGGQARAFASVLRTGSMHGREVACMGSPVAKVASTFI